MTYVVDGIYDSLIYGKSLSGITGTRTLDLVILLSHSVSNVSWEKNEASAEILCLALPQILFRAFDEAFVLPQLHLCYQKINVIKEVI